MFKNIALAKVATSAEEGKAFGYFRATDGVSFDRARQLVRGEAARASASREAGYHPPAPRAYRLPGESGIATLQHDGRHARRRQATPASTTRRSRRKLADVLCGGVGGATREVTEDEILELEREAFLSASAASRRAQERMQYMLMNNKPLRN